MSFCYARKAFCFSSRSFAIIPSFSSNQLWLTSFSVPSADCADFFTKVLNWSHFCVMLPINNPWCISLSFRLAANCWQCPGHFSFPVLKEGLTIFSFFHCTGTMCSVRIDLVSQWSVQHSLHTWPW